MPLNMASVPYMSILQLQNKRKADVQTSQVDVKHALPVVNVGI
jgi:hypothetical protein